MAEKGGDQKILLERGKIRKGGVTLERGDEEFMKYIVFFFFYLFYLGNIIFIHSFIYLF